MLRVQPRPMGPKRVALAVAALLVAGVAAAGHKERRLAAASAESAESADEELTVPFASWRNVPETLQHLLAFLMVLVGAHPLGLLFPRYLRLPLITGYLVVGILAGPFVANLLGDAVVTMLASYVNAFALSFISFQAGQEIFLPELAPQLRSIVALLGTFYLTAMAMGTSVLVLAAGAFFYADLAGSCQLGIALMFASISVLVSPSTVMALKIELNSVGPFTHLALGTCMMAEFVVLVSFSVSRVVASIYCARLDVSPASIVFTLGVVLLNVVLGGLLGLVIVLIFQLPSGHADVPGDDVAHVPVHGVSVASRGSQQPSGVPVVSTDTATSRKTAGDLEQALDVATPADAAPHPHNAYVEVDEADEAASRGRTHWWTPRKALYAKGFLWLLLGYGFYLWTTTLSELTTARYGLVWQVKLEALLVLMLASCAAGHHRAIRHDMHVILDTAAPYIFLPFFVMTGASLQLDKVLDVLPLMSLYLALRYAAIFLAMYGGGRVLLRLPPQHYRNLWLTMAPQAGVSLGLAAEVNELITEAWGAEFAATIVAAVVVNQVVGPVLCATGLRRAGESMHDRQQQQQQQQQPAAGKDEDAEHAEDAAHAADAQDDAAASRSRSRTASGYAPSSTRSGDPRALLPFYRVQSAVVLGDDETAFEVALELSLYGAHVNVPLLDEARADKWRRMNETILRRTAKGELLSFRNALQERQPAADAARDSGVQAADVLVLTGDADRSLEHAKVLQTMLGDANRPRLIAVVGDCQVAAQLRELGVLTVQPAVALANIATRLALLEAPLAAALSKELCSASNFSTAAYFRGDADADGDRDRDGDRDSLSSLSELRLPGRRLALGRSVVNHHSVDYDRLAEALAAENLPLPPPPSRVSMFGTSAVEHDPFATRAPHLGAYEHYVVEDDGPPDDRSVFEEQFMAPSPRSSLGGGRSRSRRRSRLGSASSSVSGGGGGGAGYVQLRRGHSTGL